jgi:CubicO group peptidase (beta-lactamase class C family)
MTAKRLRQIGLTAIGTAALATSIAAVRGQTAAPPGAAVDQLFSRWTETTPGCAVGATVDGRSVVSKAYGMADLEHDVKNTADTIFEAGSVSKQFTAAAVLLLARESKLSLDDPVRKYIPELPEYGVPLTIRHMLNHTSGLRDWGSVAGIGGWPRTTRAYTHAHVLEIVSRQRALNFTPGTRYSYSNTGYNLSAILVSRVSGLPFAEFSSKRIFGPVGMTRTSWRDDHQRIVKDRAIAYSDQGGQFETLMPFENVHGNGGLLTTVGDLLKWNENFSTHVIGDAAFVREQETAGRFNDGRVHGYALGLMVGTRNGLREIAHSGSTAGYRAHLTRFPDQKVNVAVLCNVSSGNATQLAEAVADLYLAPRMKKGVSVKAAHALSAAEAAAVTGMFRDTVTGEAVTIVAAENAVRVGGARGPLHVAMSATRFVADNGSAWEVDARGSATLTDRHGTVDTFAKTEPSTPGPADLQALTGTYVNDEAETALIAAFEAGALVLKRRPDTTIRLAPLYKDAFSGSIGTVIFRRNGSGRVIELAVSQDRVWDLRFARRDQASSTAR